MFLTETGIIYRGIRPLQKLGSLALNNPFSNIQLSQQVPEALLVVPPDPWAGDALRGRDMIAGIFTFAGQTIGRENLSWMPEEARPEWISSLHSFEWLRDVRSVGGDRARRMARDMVTNWIDRFQKTTDAIWSPAITGARLSAWISFHDFFAGSADDEFRRHYFMSLVKQARHLSRCLTGGAPDGLNGIALMRALKGLAYSGLALEDGTERLEQALHLILKEIRTQVMPDGGHISRSPQATFAFLQMLVDLRGAFNAARLPLPEDIQFAIDRLVPAVKFFRHGDGCFAQFNGGQEGNAHICEATLMHSGARGRAMKSLPHTGYEKMHQGRAMVIMDTGTPIGGDYADMAHAGMLGFEYSFGKDRVIVNCGSSAVDGTWRDLLRATAAHSTLTADGRNACQFDADGRATGLPDIRSQRHEDDDIALIEAGHNGYMPRYGLSYRRCLRLRDNGEVLTGEEVVGGKSGTRFAIRFHLHPFIRAEAVEGSTDILLRARSGMRWLFRAAGEATIHLEESVYVGKGDKPERSLQIVLNGTTTGATMLLNWDIVREKP